MGVFFSVGVLSSWIRDPQNYGVDMRDYFAEIGATLHDYGLPPHSEPETLPPLATRLDYFGISSTNLHSLRRLYAYAVANDGALVPPLADDACAADDPVIAQVSAPAHHLLWHSDCDGCYVPVEFAQAVCPADAGCVGSTQRLMRELIEVAPLLGVRCDGAQVSDAEIARLDDLTGTGPYAVELRVWLLFYETARLSLEYRTAMVLG